MLATVFDVWGLSPRYETKDGLSVGVGGYVIKAFLSPSFPLLPACYAGWVPPADESTALHPHASVFLFVCIALCLDACLLNRLKVGGRVCVGVGVGVCVCVCVRACMHVYTHFSTTPRTSTSTTLLTTAT